MNVDNSPERAPIPDALAPRLLASSPGLPMRPLVWIDLRLHSLADTGHRADAVIVPAAWHRRAELVDLVARDPRVRVVVECDETDRLVLATLRAVRRDVPKRSIRCLLWRNVAQ